MTAQQLVDLIYRETGQVTSKGAVIGGSRFRMRYWSKPGR